MHKGIAVLVLVLAAVGGWLVYSGQLDTHEESGEQTHEEGHDDEHDEHELVAKEPVREDGRFSIATSFYPLEFALSRIVGDLAEVRNVGAGRDPHDFRPSTQDIRMLQEADLVVLQGAQLEPWGEDVSAQLRQVSVPVVRATAELDLREAGEHHGAHEGEQHADAHADDAHEEEMRGEDGHSEDGHAAEHGAEHEEEHEEKHADESHEDEHGHEHGAYDPHTWLDPVLFSETIEHLAEAVSALDPENADTYEANAAALQDELAALHSEYDTALATCSMDEVIVSHDAYSYLAERYGITMHTIAGLSTQDRPSAQTLAALKEEAEEGVGAILLEENSIAAFGETLAAETGLTTLPVDPIASAIPQGEDYLTLMRANLETLRTALQCNG
ncbi:zinc ABC transporter solute-binding protein [Patescibacteria group bacterium]|jgi:zinc transport system substrate-binding protein|nr:zinc ABC transporter solute-binding protein [Patescibacteria group bacterium]